LSDELLQRQREFIHRRQQAYRSVFSGPEGAIVLADLVTFCRARTSTMHPDPRAAAQLDGRREVFLRIQEHTQLTEDDLWALKEGG
jgi:hypothetical protein